MTSPALDALDATGIAHRVVRHGPVHSLEEAAAQAGVAIPDVVKTIVVRRSADDFVFVLVPGGRAISWPKLRALLGVNRLSLPDAAAAKEATGYERGTITPFGATRQWPVVADERLRGRTVRIGAGERNAAVVLDADEMVRALAATGADVTVADVTGSDVTGSDVTGSDVTGADDAAAKVTGQDDSDPDATSPDVAGPDDSGPDVTGSAS